MRKSTEEINPFELLGEMSSETLEGLTDWDDDMSKLTGEELEKLRAQMRSMNV